MPDPEAARSSGGVTVELDAGVALITIDRPEARPAEVSRFVDAPIGP